MAVEASQPFKISRPAGADQLNNQYLVLKDDGSGNAILVTAATDVPIGVLQNKPRNRSLGLSGQSPTSNAAEMAELVVLGRTKMVAAGAINPGAQVTFTSGGKVVAASGLTNGGATGLAAAYHQATNWVIGYLDQPSAAANNDDCTVNVNIVTPLTAS